jgi:hypothetical protein
MGRVRTVDGVECFMGVGANAYLCCCCCLWLLSSSSGVGGLARAPTFSSSTLSLSSSLPSLSCECRGVAIWSSFAVTRGVGGGGLNEMAAGDVAICMMCLSWHWLDYWPCSVSRPGLLVRCRLYTLRLWCCGRVCCPVICIRLSLCLSPSGMTNL